MATAEYARKVVEKGWAQRHARELARKLVGTRSGRAALSPRLRCLASCRKAVLLRWCLAMRVNNTKTLCLSKVGVHGAANIYCVRNVRSSAAWRHWSRRDRACLESGLAVPSLVALAAHVLSVGPRCLRGGGNGSTLAQITARAKNPD
jgi:hypothetical protein